MTTPITVTITDPRDLSDRQLLLLLLERITAMSTAVESETAAEAVLSAKVDLLLVAFGDAKTQNAALAAGIADLTAQVADLRTNGFITEADSAKLSAALSDMQAKSTAIDTALTPAAPPVAG